MSEIINANYFSPTENDNLLFDCNAETMRKSL